MTDRPDLCPPHLPFANYFGDPTESDDEGGGGGLLARLAVGCEYYDDTGDEPSKIDALYLSPVGPSKDDSGKGPSFDPC